MNKYIKVLFAFGFILSLSSCLKDKNFDDGLTGHDIDGAGVPKVIELAIINSPAHNRSLAIDFKDEMVEVPVLTVRLAALEVASEDITVTIDTSFSAALLLGYDTTNTKTTARLPIAFHSFVGGLKVVIPKGSREAVLKIQTNSINYNPSTTYGVGFKIASVDKPGYTISENFGTYVTTIGAKNPYDGIYKLVFTNYHPTANSGYTGATTEVRMITTGANTVKIFFDPFDGYYNPAVLSGALTAFASQEPEYTINPTTFVVTVQNAFPGAATFYTMNPSFNSYYDPATKKIFAKFGYNYVGGTFSAASSREWTQEFTYLRPR